MKGELAALKKEGKITEPETEPCPKCSGRNIKFSDCGYTIFNPGEGKCLDCGFVLEFKSVGDGQAGLAWNEQAPRVCRSCLGTGKCDV